MSGETRPQAPEGLEQSGPVFDRARRLACTLFKDVDAAVVLMGDGEAWRSHDPGGQAPKDAPVARLVIDSGELLWIADASLDECFRHRPNVTGPAHVRFYAAAPIRLEDGSIPGVFAVAGTEPKPYDEALAARLQDLADVVADEWSRVQARNGRETARRESDVARRMVAQILDTAPLSLLMTDLEMRIISASPRWIESRQLGDNAVIGHSLYELFPSTYEKWRPVYDRCLAGESVQADRVEFHRPNGSIIWLQVELTPWRESNGEIGGLIISSHDVTNMVEALERTERSEERLRVAMETADIHVWELDYRRRELINIGAAASFYNEEPTYPQLARDIWSTIDERDLPRVQEEWRRHQEEGAAYRPEYRVRRSDHREVWVQGAVRYLTDDQGKPLRMIGALQNITDRKAAELALVQAKEEAESATRAKSAFLATMSHEIRTPLNGVLGMAQAMAMGTLDAEQRQRLDVIRQSGESLLAILNDVLDLSKIEAGKLELERAEFDLEETVQGALSAFAATAQAKGLALTLNIQPAARGVYVGDSVRVRQILYNLISNGLKFTGKGEVKVTLSRRGRRLRLQVADTGIGVAPEKLAGLFQKFEQADASTTRRYGGTGLGLSICRDLAALMGGEIHAESRLGEGATFTVELPLERTADSPERTSRVAGTRPVVMEEAVAIRVLAAEDNSMNQLVLRTLLAQIGIEPTIVGNGREAVEAWASEPWDMILMDVQMPDVDGPTATGMIRARERAAGLARTPIVALTANAMAHQVAEYAEAGMDDFVAKPIEAARLFEAIAVALETRRKAVAEAAAA
ncbi:ATP-binding protein [Phenylobacterium sp.]|jgi:PAS domain S-box-containing protein|uniref:ATP-binding protein n=1 Tax=Phenylobacterium sp. TaxID=1871053 RepID=UPI002E30175F|nr:ATP-binding protein [Phenylobacterium sp.]HEX3365453.1 ATP-binding protein [Phenylobacterium sp.]